MNKHRKVILGTLAAAAMAAPLAMAAAPANAASAPARCQVTTTTPTTVTETTTDFSTVKGHFVVTEPAGSFENFDNVWTHDINVIQKLSDGSFEGTGTITGHDPGQDPIVPVTEKVTGTWSLGADGEANTTDDLVTVTIGVGDSVERYVVNAPLNTEVRTKTTVHDIMTKVSNIEVTPNPIDVTTTTTKDVTTTTDYANHGAYVEAMGGGKLAAQACAGMPLNSNKPSVR